ncbi:hypothetical protein B0H11DRAFT_1876116 [Mycena galericulata]|nr:hypothetical protein B0H11DRAFT_1876116 [Mycena galericulata]
MYNMPDPAVLNQYSDIGLQYPHAPRHTSSQHAPDITTMMTALHLRQEHLVEQNRALVQANSDLQARLASVEEEQSTSVRPTESSNEPSRLRPVSVRTRSQSRPRHLPPSAADDVHLPSLGNPRDLSPKQKKAREGVKRYVTNTFRTVCGVSKQENWPNPEVQRINEVTGEVYLTPLFECGVTDTRNMLIFAAVAKQVDDEFADEACHPPGLADCGATWDIEVFKKMAKESFEGFKRQWRAVHDEAARAKKEEDLRTNRRRGRRIMKAEERTTDIVIEQYAAAKNLDPKVLKDIMRDEHMSDEESGPEDVNKESFANWKARMARAAGYGVLTPAALAKLNFLEVLEADWRSEDLSKLFLDVHRAWWDSRTPREKSNIKFIRVRGTGRSSSRIPKVAPFNFGISQPWLERHRFDPNFRDLLEDWGDYTDPVGFSSSQDAGAEALAADTGLNIPIDPQFCSPDSTHPNLDSDA